MGIGYTEDHYFVIMSGSFPGQLHKWQASQSASGKSSSYHWPYRGVGCFKPKVGVQKANIWRLKTRLLWVEGAEQLGKAIHLGEGNSDHKPEQMSPVSLGGKTYRIWKLLSQTRADGARSVGRQHI
jgi:hypothetical protein